MGTTVQQLLDGMSDKRLTEGVAQLALLQIPVGNNPS